MVGKFHLRELCKETSKPMKVLIEHSTEASSSVQLSHFIKADK